MYKKATIIGAGVAGPIMALQLKKAGIEAQVFEARAAYDTKEGAFLGITPNGLNILKEFVDLERFKADYTPGSMKFYNQGGKQIAELSTDYQTDKYGAETMQLKRADLNNAVREVAIENGIEIFYNKCCINVSSTENEVNSSFEDGSLAKGNILIACDGTFSAVRKSLFPKRYAPQYTQCISTGGYAHLSELSLPSEVIHMTFGERGFFAYSVSNKGEVWWFNNYFREKEPTREEVNTKLKNEIQAYLLELHKNDDPLFSKIIKVTDEMIVYPVYDIPKLEKWYQGNSCLIGDAAHAISPHVGQGASLALEDTAVLARCLHENSNVQQAFQQFQNLRQGRVEKIIKQARKIGNNKSKPNPIATWFRDRLLNFFIKGEIKKLDWVYGYRTE